MSQRLQDVVKRMSMEMSSEDLEGFFLARADKPDAKKANPPLITWPDCLGAPATRHRGEQVPACPPAFDTGTIRAGQSELRTRILEALQPRMTRVVPERLVAQAVVSKLFSSLNARISTLRQQVEEVSTELRNRPVVKTATLLDLGVTELSLLMPIQIVIEEYQEEVTASWPEVEAFGSGDSVSEAILALKRDIVALYDDLHATSDGDLGTLPVIWKRILEGLVVPVDKA
ncbi:MAG: hypothetical protein M1305_04940 [Candidatus Marsarchaeota archaeon]|nr:hypothetical protein [Candidatus Marsarchaeota archaeon]